MASPSYGIDVVAFALAVILAFCFFLPRSCRSLRT